MTSEFETINIGRGTVQHPKNDPVAPLEARHPRIRHIKRGSTYRVIGTAIVQTDRPLVDYAEVTIYQSETDGKLWVRPIDEMKDGRFEELGAAAEGMRE